MFNSPQYKCLLYIRCSVNILQQTKKHRKFNDGQTMYHFHSVNCVLKPVVLFLFYYFSYLRFSPNFFYFCSIMLSQKKKKVTKKEKKDTNECPFFDFIYMNFKSSQHFNKNWSNGCLQGCLEEGMKELPDIMKMSCVSRKFFLCVSTFTSLKCERVPVSSFKTKQQQKANKQNANKPWTTKEI